MQARYVSWTSPCCHMAEQSVTRPDRRACCRHESQLTKCLQLERVRNRQHRTGAMADADDSICRTVTAHAHPTQLQGEALPVNACANREVDDRRRTISVNRFGVAVQHSDVREQANAVEQRWREIELAVDGSVVLPEIPRRVVHPPGQVLISKPHVCLRVVVAWRCGDDRVVGPGLETQSGRHAPGIPAKADGLYASRSVKR